MADTERFPAAGKSDKKQNGKRTIRERLEGKKQMIALWTTVLGLLSAEGIPAIVEALSDKPSTGQVQAMIGAQTEKLSKEQHVAVDAIKELDNKLSGFIDDNSEHRTVTGRLEGTVSLLRDVLRDCCTRRRVRERLDEEPAAMGTGVPPEVHAGHAHIVVHDDGDGDGVPDEGLPDMIKKAMGKKKKKRKKPPIERLEKVPEFNMQQQLQIQMPEE
jgi:hypothetical protein